MEAGALYEYKEKPGACADCGNSPVNHIETYLAQTFSVWSGDGKSAWKRRLDAWSDFLASKLDQVVYRFFAALPGTRFVNEVTGAKTYRSQVVWEEAIRRGIRMEQMILFGRHTDVYRALLPSGWRYFMSLPIPPHLEYPAYGWIDDKHVLKRVLKQAGIPVPATHSVTSLSDARKAFSEIGAPVVVKPRAGSRARHTTVHVRTEEDLGKAFKSAQKLCRYVSIEQHLHGHVCRGTVVDGKLVGFFEGRAPIIVGDGVSAIEQLVEQTNEQRPARVEKIALTDEHEQFLRRMGYTRESVLPRGTVVQLTHRTGRLFGGRTREILGKEHPKLREYLERATKAVRAPIVGFDLIINDPEADPDAQEWGIIEANSLPYIDLHYLPLEGMPSNPAAAVWNLWATVPK